MSTETEAQILERLARIEEMLHRHEAETARKLPDRPMAPAEFARAIGKSVRTVMRWIDSGKLSARREGRVTLIAPANAQRFLSGPGVRV